jgi:hypothetical protein
MPTNAMPNGRMAGIVGAVYGVKLGDTYRYAMTNKKRGYQIISNVERKFKRLSRVSTHDKGAIILRS